MYFLLSSRSQGSLQVLRVKPDAKGPQVKLKHEFKPEGKVDYAQKILSFSILNKSLCVVARKSGLLQMYEKQRSSEHTMFYKLVKEWKNSTLSPRDNVIAVGSFRNQFMYTCSVHGKFVVRDLINDDADDSVKCYLLDAPIRSVTVQTSQNNSKVLIVAGGMNCQLNFYELDLSSNTSCYFSMMCPTRESADFYSRTMLQISPHQQQQYNRPLSHYHRGTGRSRSGVYHVFAESTRVVPSFTLSPFDYEKYPHSPEKIENVISSVQFVETSDKSYICTGTQFGELIVYQSSSRGYEHSSHQIFHLSRFSINTLASMNHDRYLVYTDSMSKVGVMDTHTWTVVNFYDFLLIGPAAATRIYFHPSSSTKTSKFHKVTKFEPFFIVATTFTGNLVIYKLFDDNHCELKVMVSKAGIIPAFDLMHLNPYQALYTAFEGNVNGPLHCTKRSKA